MFRPRICRPSSSALPMAHSVSFGSQSTEHRLRENKAAAALGSSAIGKPPFFPIRSNAFFNDAFIEQTPLTVACQ